jgi:hypothetical protein
VVGLFAVLLAASEGSTQSPSTARPTSPQVFASMYGKYQYLSSQVLASSYANLFLVIAVLTAACVGLALFLRTPTNESSSATSAGAAPH